MTTALAAARQHLDALAANQVAARDKPNAFHHGLLTTLVAELERRERELVEAHATIVDLCRRHRSYLRWQLNVAHVEVRAATEDGQ